MVGRKRYGTSFAESGPVSATGDGLLCATSGGVAARHLLSASSFALVCYIVSGCQRIIPGASWIHASSLSKGPVLLGRSAAVSPPVWLLDSSSTEYTSFLRCSCLRFSFLASLLSSPLQRLVKRGRSPFGCVAPLYLYRGVVQLLHPPQPMAWLLLRHPLARPLRMLGSLYTVV